MSRKTTDGEMLFEHDPKGAFAQFVAPMAGYGVTTTSFFRFTVTGQYPHEPARVMSRFHDRHQLNRYDDGLEKCVGCELCAWACLADAVLVEAASNTPEEQYSVGERYGHVHQINYLHCIFYSMCIEACPTHALTMANDFEIVKYTREGDIYEKEDLPVPLSDGMFVAPHPMVGSKNSVDYYRGEVIGPTTARADWITSRHPGDLSLKTVRVAEEAHQ